MITRRDILAVPVMAAAAITATQLPVWGVPVQYKPLSLAQAHDLLLPGLWAFGSKHPNLKFDMQLMATQPEPSGKQQGDNQTSDRGSGAGYGDTRTHWVRWGYCGDFPSLCRAEYIGPLTRNEPATVR